MLNGNLNGKEIEKKRGYIYVVVIVVQSLSHFVSLRTHGLQHARLSCLSPSPRACSNPFLLNQWCHPTISSSVAFISFCLQFFPAAGSFLMSQLFASGGQSFRASTSTPVLPMNIQDYFPLRLTDLITLLSREFSGVFSSKTFQKHSFFGAQPSLWSNSHICPWLLENHSFD